MISVLIFQLNMVGVLSAKGYGGTTQHTSATVSTYSHEAAKTVFFFFFPSRRGAASPPNLYSSHVGLPSQTVLLP